MLLFFVIASVAKQSMPPQSAKWIASSLTLLARTVFDRNYRLNSKISGRDFGERRLERGRRARQLREGQAAIRGLLLRFRGGRANLRDRFSSIKQGLGRDYVKLMGFDGLVFQQEDPDRDDILATP